MLHERHTKRQLLKELDYIGIFLWTAGLVGSEDHQLRINVNDLTDCVSVRDFMGRYPLSLEVWSSHIHDRHRSSLAHRSLRIRGLRKVKVPCHPGQILRQSRLHQSCRMCHRG